jgi:hypothetical protein
MEPGPGWAGLWEASQLLYCSRLRSASQTSATLMVDGTVASLGYPTVSAACIAATGSMAGVTDAMAGGGCRVGMVFPSISGVGLLS